MSDSPQSCRSSPRLCMSAHCMHTAAEGSSRCSQLSCFLLIVLLFQHLRKKYYISLTPSRAVPERPERSYDVPHDCCDRYGCTRAVVAPSARSSGCGRSSRRWWRGPPQSLSDALQALSTSETARKLLRTTQNRHSRQADRAATCKAHLATPGGSPGQMLV